MSIYVNESIDCQWKNKRIKEPRKIKSRERKINDGNKREERCRKKCEKIKKCERRKTSMS
jgi:hypothetical protein